MSRANLVRLVLLALILGSSFLWMSIALRGFSPVQITFARLALGAMVLAVIVFARGLRFPRGWRIWVHLAMAALFANAVPYLLFSVGQQQVASSVAGVINASTPLWTLVFAFAVGAHRELTARRGAGLLIGFTGTLVIFAPWGSVHEAASWGGVACLAAAASYGVSYVYMGRFLAGRGVPPLLLSAAQLSAATLIMLVAVPSAGLDAVEWRADSVAALAVLGAFGTGIAYTLNYRLLRDEGATATSTVTHLLPVVAVVLGAAVLAEPVTVTMIGGMVLVLAGVALAQRSGGRATPPTRRVG